MKKFFIAVSAIAIATFSQAASVTWASGDLAEMVTSDIESITGYYYVLGGDTAVELANYVDTTTGSLKNMSYDGTSGKIMVEGKDIVNVNMTYDAGEGNDVPSPTYVALIYVAKSINGGSYAIATKGVYEVGDSGYETDNNNTGGALASYIESQSSVASAWTAVPEPTTVALLALGLAAVGLKRKVA